jgi:large subunit ribosomal protein L23
MDYNDIIIRPVVSEKTSDMVAHRKYAFRVSMKANKHIVKKAIKELFNVTVEKVNIIVVRGKRKRVRHQYGITPAWKKAVVTLKDGQKIELFEGQ